VVKNHENKKALVELELVQIVHQFEDMVVLLLALDKMKLILKRLLIKK